MPGVLAGFIGAMMASGASFDQYGFTLYEKFPARLPDGRLTATYNETLREIGSEHLIKLDEALGSLGAGEARSAPKQAAMQFLAIILTLGVAIIGGAITGFILRLPVFDIVEKKRLFEDDYLWEVADFNTSSVVVETKPEAIEEEAPATLSAARPSSNAIVEMKELTTPLVS